MDGWLERCNGWRSTPWWADKSTAYLNHTTIYYADTHKHTNRYKGKEEGGRREGKKAWKGGEEAEVKKGGGEKAERTD